MATVAIGTAVTALAASALAIAAFRSGRIDADVAALALTVILCGAGTVTAVAGTVIGYERRSVMDATDQLHSIASQSRDWIWRAGEGGILTYSSPGVRTLLGYDPSEVVGRSTFELMAPGDRSLGRTLTDLAVEAHSSWERTEAAWLHADGHVVRLVGTAEPILDHQGRLTGYRGIRSLPDGQPTDLTERRAAVKAIIDDRAFDIALQPIVDAGSGRWVGAEALARFEQGSPPEVLLEAERVGLGSQLEAALVDAALDLIWYLPTDAYLSVNLSPTALVHPMVGEVLGRHRAYLGRIAIELTEHVQVHDYDVVTQMLANLRRAGLRLAVDDAGAGHSSFLHVVRLHPDIIKLDRDLIAGIGTDPVKKAVARAMCELASHLGASVVAEGVETHEDIRITAQLGLTLQQGFGIAAPTRDPSEWERWQTRRWVCTASTA